MNDDTYYRITRSTGDKQYFQGNRPYDTETWTSDKLNALLFHHSVVDTHLIIARETAQGAVVTAVEL